MCLHPHVNIVTDYLIALGWSVQTVGYGGDWCDVPTLTYFV